MNQDYNRGVRLERDPETGKKSEKFREKWTFGNREGMKYLRIYLRGAVYRFEVELKGKIAAATKHLFLHMYNPKQVIEYGIGAIRGCVDFLDPSKKGKDTNRSRAPLATWWEKITDRAQTVRFSVDKPAPTIKRVIDWMENQIAPTMSVLFEANEGTWDGIMKFIELLVECGAKRKRKRHQALLDDALASKKTCIDHLRIKEAMDHLKHGERMKLA